MVPAMRKSLFQFTGKLPDSSTIHVEDWLTFPMNLTIDQCFDQMICAHHIPVSCLKEFRQQLSEFIDKQNTEDYQVKYCHWLEKIRTSGIDASKVCPQTVVAQEKNIDSSISDQIFMEAYKNIVHSSTAATKLMNLERSLASVILDEIKQRDDTLRPIDDNLCELIERPSLANGRISPESITLLQKDFCMFREAVETKSDQCIEDLKQDQRREFTRFVLSLNEKINSETRNNENWSAKTDEIDIPLGLISKSLPLSTNDESVEASQTKSSNSSPWSETFTVQLGRQIRSSCNFRLIRIDPEEVLNNMNMNTSNSEHDIAERLHNALSLCSNTLHGFVIFVDRNFGSFCGIKRVLFKACERSTEFHFPDLKAQLNSIRQTISCLHEPSSANQQQTETVPKSQPRLIDSAGDPISSGTGPYHGDVYITKHSNLVGDIAGINIGGGIHVVFHVVTDLSQEDHVRAPSALHCALSAILRTCFDYDITSLTLPLLFVPTMREYKDANWREKRAETVLKAIKGALMELITWRGPSLKSIQFLLPSTLSDKELRSFSQIISTSFLQPNPLIGTG